MKIPDLLNLLALVISLASLVVSIVALSAAKRVAAISISTPLVLEHLYELVEYLNKRKLDSDLAKDVDRLFEEIAKVREKSFVLRQAGFGSRLDEFESKVKAFSTLCKQLQGRAANVTPAETETLMQRTYEVDKTLQALLRDIEPKLESVFKDPFRGQA